MNREDRGRLFAEVAPPELKAWLAECKKTFGDCRLLYVKVGDVEIGTNRTDNTCTSD